MEIHLTKKEIKEVEDLRRCLHQQLIPVDRLISLLDGLQLKVINPEAAPVKRNVLRDQRTNKYRVKLLARTRQI